MDKNKFISNHKRFLNKSFQLISISMLFMGSIATVGNVNVNASSTKETIKNAKPSENFYNYVNHKWLNKVKIPNDKASVGSIANLSDKNEKTLKNDISKLANGNHKNLGTDENNMITYYKQALDKEQLNKLGGKPLKPYLNSIENIKNKNDYLNAIRKWNIEGKGIQAMPFNFDVTADTLNSKKKVVNLGFPGTILSDKSLYENGNEQGTQIIKAYSKAVLELMHKMGVSNNVAQQRLNNCLKLDAKIAKYMPSSESAADMSNIKNVSAKKVTKDASSEINIVKMINDVCPKKVNKFLISDQNTLKNYNKIFDLNDINEIKDWTYVSTLIQNADNLSPEFQNIVNNLYNKILGVNAKRNLKDSAFEKTNASFSPVLGKLYVKNNFNKKTDKKVNLMVKNIIKTYKQELQNNNWLSKSTKKNAIKKLDNMVIKVGYPKKIDSIYYKIKINKNKSFFENNANINKLQRQSLLKSLSQKASRYEWATSPQIVNAFYDPTSNSITIPAGILQYPFFSLKQSASANYGAIGVVIGHEISHAFDTNGSKFDSKGNMKNWWTKKDYKEFNKRTNRIVKRFNGLEFMGNKVNGKLTLTENTADLEGIRASIATAKKEHGFNSKEFFRSYATMWRSKSRPQVAQIQMMSDPHAPDIWRVNAQLPNINEFYKAYDIKKGSPMWVSKNNRLSIW